MNEISSHNSVLLKFRINILMKALEEQAWAGIQTAKDHAQVKQAVVEETVVQKRQKQILLQKSVQQRADEAYELISQ